MFDVYDDIEKIKSKVNSMKALVMISTMKADTLKVKFKKFMGVKTVGIINCGLNQRFDLEMCVDTGRARLVAVDGSGHIISLNEGTFSGELDTETVPGLYRIRLVGEAAGGEIKLKKI